MLKEQAQNPCWQETGRDFSLLSAKIVKILA
jgi:hypothetical protein